MKLIFLTEEKQYINMILKDAIQGAKNNKARNVVRYGLNLLEQFQPNIKESNLKLKELDVLTKLVDSSILTLENLLNGNKIPDKKDILINNLEFAKKFSFKMNEILSFQSERYSKLKKKEII